MIFLHFYKWQKSLSNRFFGERFGSLAAPTMTSSSATMLELVSLSLSLSHTLTLTYPPAHTNTFTHAHTHMCCCRSQLGLFPERDKTLRRIRFSFRQPRSFPFKTSDGGASEYNLGLNGRALDYRSESPDFRSHW